MLSSLALLSHSSRATAQESYYPYQDNSGWDDTFDDDSGAPADAPAQDYNSYNPRPPAPVSNYGTSRDTPFSADPSNLHFKMVDGDFWYKGKCRACDREGRKINIDSNALAKKPKAREHRNKHSQKRAV